MTRKPLFWVLLCVLSAGSSLVAISWFERAFPVVTLDLRMDRELALKRAAEVAEQLGLGPDGYAQAASFGVDQEVQNYVELEAGGSEGLRELIASGLYPLYRWTVRHYRENEIREALLLFSPEGKAVGFRLKLPEAEPGAQLAGDEARLLAEPELARWVQAPQAWDLVEETTETRTGGRRDHHFVYELTSRTLGEARYRFVVSVAGGRVSRAEPTVRLPEAFGRRYQEMRSANDTLALGAGLAVGLLYLVAGCGFGLFLLLRRRALLWRQAVLWGTIIGGLQFLAGLNQYPLIWMSYDTALSSGQFMLKWVLSSLGEGLAVGTVLGLAFLVAEGLTRQAFPHQIQLWSVWSAGPGSSRPVLGQTVAGFLLVPMFFAYETVLYFLTRTRFEWWSPSDSLLHPDTLANFLPWLNPIAISAQAGFGEECLFRAVPLASAALLGRRFGRPAWWIGSALLLQAIIFGAAHANYATQPFYARMVELILPSLLFGGLYLIYGLLPAVILHFAFDVVWFALPVFVASSPSVRDDQLLVVALTLVPLWVILYRRFRAGAWTEVPASAFNSGWTPPAVEAAPSTSPVALETSPIGTRMRLTLLVGGVLGLAVYLGLWESKEGIPSIDMDRTAAEGSAREFLATEGDEPLRALTGPEWKLMSWVESGRDPTHEFVWATSGRDVYARLLGNYLGTPGWAVRVARFEGPLEERAEELAIRFTPQGGMRRVTHTLPEHRPAPGLDREIVVEMARQAVAERFPVPEELRPVTVEPAQLPERRDWTVVFADPAVGGLAQGEARIRVRVSGDRVTDVSRFVFVPEDWTREQRNRRSMTQIVNGACALVLVLLVLLGAVMGIVAWSRHRFHRRAFVVFGGLFCVLKLLGEFNQWPVEMARLSTAEPYSHQVGAVVALSLMAALLQGLVFGLVAGLVFGRLPIWSGGRLQTGHWTAAVGLAGLVAGFGTLIHRAGSDGSPNWPSLAGVDHWWPPLSVAVAGGTGLIAQSLFLLLVVALAYHLRLKGAPVRRILLLVLVGVGIGGSSQAPDLTHLAMAAGLGGLALVLVEAVLFRVPPAWIAIPAMVPVLLTVVDLLVDGAYPGARWGALVGILAIAVAGWGWWRFSIGRAAEAEP